MPALSYLVGRRNIQTTPWNSERDALLAKLWAEGYSASAIAEQIMDVHVSRCAVIGRAHRLKLPARAARQKARKVERKPRMWKPKSRPEQLAKVSRDVPLGEPKMRRVKLVDLKPTSCRWPIGDGSPFLFCAADAAEDAVYCPFHQRTARVREKAK